MKTIKVKHGDDYMVINESDYDAEKHALFVDGETAEAAATASETLSEIPPGFKAGTEAVPPAGERPMDDPERVEPFEADPKPKKRGRK